MGCWMTFTLIIFACLYGSSVTYVIKIVPEGGLILPDWVQYNNYKELSHPGSYRFGYDIEHSASNNVQFKNEVRHPNGTVTGSYGYLEPDGNIHITHYVADDFGYRVLIEDSKRSTKHKLFPGNQDVDEKALNFSPQMLAAIEAQKVYKRQETLESRDRPIDKENVQTLSNNDIESTTKIQRFSSTKGYFPILYPRYTKSEIQE